MNENRFWHSVSFKLVIALACLGFSLYSNAEDLVPMQIPLPNPAFIGTPPADSGNTGNIDKPRGKPYPPLMVPAGVKNVALGKTVTSSASNALPDKLAKITDGQKESSDANTIQLRKGVQWIQIDLGSPQDIYAIILWHAFDTPKVYHGVVVQVSDDPAFKTGVHTLFNNDHSNEDGLGAGTDHEYFESNEGKLIQPKGTTARYVRLYSRGSTESRLNEYTEVEVYGRPAKS